jgi:hypothetical protein
MPYLDLLGSDMRLHFFSCVISSFVFGLGDGWVHGNRERLTSEHFFLHCLFILGNVFMRS